ncbi:hypothetical protein [Polaromonas sp.]|uniref:hypothetical protein n=1 Tax=Polaromonas sp. TaxID=1869339 RepID=UPI00272F38CF|nr:hypothetical protein [Polaromonas sp.]MDP1742368.1 hypothetical protein [Polaromonas sp.]
MNTPRNQTDLVVGHYQPWRTATHCALPEPRRFLQSGSGSTGKKIFVKSACQWFQRAEKPARAVLLTLLLEKHERLEAEAGFQPSQNPRIT